MAKQFPLWLHKLGSPPIFYRFAGIRPWALGLALLLGVVAAYGGLVVAPPDYQQHGAYRIIFIHVPSACMSLFIYVAMGVSAFIALVWRIKPVEVVTMASASIGAAHLRVAGVVSVSGRARSLPRGGRSPFHRHRQARSNAGEYIGILPDLRICFATTNR